LIGIAVLPLDLQPVSNCWNFAVRRRVASKRGWFLQMRYHKVSAISSSEATCILAGAWLSLNPHAVVNLFDEWFDIRRMTANEVNHFTDDFMRVISGAIQAGIITPH
jgi:hypothetical protein